MHHNSTASTDASHWVALRQKVCARNQTLRRTDTNSSLETLHSTDGDSSIHLWINREPRPFPLHWHPTAEIIMPVENNYSIVVDHTTYHLKERDIFLIPPGALHEFNTSTEGTRLILLFDLTALSKFKGFTRLLSFLSRPCLINADTLPNSFEQERELLLQIAEEYAEGDAFSDPVIFSLLLQFFVLLARADRDILPTALPAPYRSKQREYTDKFNVVFEYIDHYYMEDITLESIAAKIGFSKFHFSRLFHQFTDTSFYDYLCLRRLKAAELLLMDPSLPITEVALQSGFSSISTFNRVFKKFKQCTPTEFKEYCRANSPRSNRPAPKKI